MKTVRFKKSFFISVPAVMVFMACQLFLYGQAERVLVRDIKLSISQYRGKTLTLVLKLKFVDRVFEKITFYDSKNIDIEFDISAKEKKKLLAEDMRTLHEGMDYAVTFTIRDLRNQEWIDADLVGFKPLVLTIIPEKEAAAGK
jgi:hypothetical protein